MFREHRFFETHLYGQQLFTFDPSVWNMVSPMLKEIIWQEGCWHQRQPHGNSVGTVGHIDEANVFNEAAVREVRDLDAPRSALASLLGCNQQSPRLDAVLIAVAVFNRQQGEIGEGLQLLERIVQIAERHRKLMAGYIAMEAGQVAAGPHGTVRGDRPTRLAIGTGDEVFAVGRLSHENELMLSANVNDRAIQGWFDRPLLVRLDMSSFGRFGFRRLDSHRVGTHRLQRAGRDHSL